MATRKLQQSQLEIQALQAGEGTRQRTESSRQSDLDRHQRDWAQRRDLAQQQSQFDTGVEQKASQFETSTDLSAAAQGLMRNPRLEALQQEMQRGERQANQGLEQTGQRRFVPAPEAQDLKERQMKVLEKNSAANYQRSVAAYERVGAQVAAAKTTAERKDLEAKQKLVEESLEQPIISDSSRLDRFMKGEYTASDMQTLRAMVKETPPVGLARALHDEVAVGEIGPNVTRFLGEKIAASAIEFIYATGKLPDGKLVDFSSAGMQEFSRRAMEARQMILPSTVAGQMLSNEDLNKVKRGYADHLFMVNKLAALLVKRQQAGGPSAALSAPEAPTHEQRRADPTKPARPAERAGQITPGEAARRAEEGGGTAAPATKRETYQMGEGWERDSRYLRDSRDR
jgi:hypothetical protein